MRIHAARRLVGILGFVVLLASASHPTTSVYSAHPGPSRQDSDASNDLFERFHDLRGILSSAASTPPNVNLQLHLSSGWVDTQEPDGYDITHGPEGTLSARACVRLIRAAIEADEQARLTELSLRSGRLRLRGNDAAQRAAVRAIRSLQAAVLDAVSIEVFRLDDSLIPRALDSVLDQASADELLADLGHTLAARDRVLLGRATLLGNSGTTTFLSDYDTETATELIAADPVVSAISMGLELGVRVDRAADGRRFVIRTWGRDGEIFRPIPTTGSHGAGTPIIERPRVATSLWVMSAIVEPGGAFVIDHDGGGESALIIRIPVSGAKEAPRSIIPLGELALPPMHTGTAWLPLAGPSGSWGWVDEDAWFTAAKWIDGTDLADVLERDLSALFAEGLVAVHGPALLLPSPDSIPRVALTAIDELRRAFEVPTIALDVRFDSLEPSLVEAAIAANGIGAFADRAAGRVLGAAVEGDALLLIGGKESAYLFDHDVQISGGASHPDPIVAGAFTGIAVACAPLRDPQDGGLTAWFDVQLQTGKETPRKIETLLFTPTPNPLPNSRAVTGSFEETLSIELPATQRALAQTFVRARDNEWTLVTARPLEGTGKTFVVVARLRVR